MNQTHRSNRRRDCFLNKKRRVTTHRRSGYLYLAVLFTSLIIAAVATASLSLSTANNRSEINRANRLSAVRLAESELHRIAAQIQDSDEWRTAATNNVYSTWVDLGANGVISSDAAQVRHRFTDVDGSLDDDNSDNVVLTAHAKVGNSNAGVSVELEPRLDPLPILNYGVTVANDMWIENNGTLSVQRPVQVGDDCDTLTSGALTTPRLECSSSVGIDLRGDLASANLDLPSDVIVDYGANATTIPVFSLPLVGSFREIRNQVLSSTTNPFGGNLDTNGVYQINANGQSIRIASSRIQATLVITNANVIEITSSVSWSYPTTPGAILVSDSVINFVDIDPILDEATQNVNFNPTSTPYRGVADTDTNDIYPTELRGMIYTTNDLNVLSVTQGRLQITGGIVCGDLRIESHVSVNQLDELLDSPPLPLSNLTPMQFIHGTFRRVAVP